MKTKSILLAVLLGCVCVATPCAGNDNVTTVANRDTALATQASGNARLVQELPDSALEDVVAALNQFDGMEGLEGLDATGVITHAKPYSLKDLERFILRVRPKTDADKEMEHENHIWSVFQPIAIVALVVALPLVALFIFLGYRQRRKKDEERMRQETLREMAKAGVTLTPEVIAAVYGKTTGRVMARPAAAAASGATVPGASGAGVSEAPAAPVYEDDPEEAKRKTEKAITNLIIGAGFCFFALFAPVWGIGWWAWILAIPGFILLAQGGAYILTRLLSKDSSTSATPEK